MSQRILWLEDVAKRLMEAREDFALMLAKEVAKPIAFSRIEVDRCVETIKITAMELANLSRITSYNVCYTKLLRAQGVPEAVRSVLERV